MEIKVSELSIDQLNLSILNNFNSIYSELNNTSGLTPELMSILLAFIKYVCSDINNLDTIYGTNFNSILAQICYKYYIPVMSYVQNVANMLRSENFNIENYVDLNENLNKIGYSGYDNDNQLGNFQNVKSTNKSRNWLLFFNYYYEKYPSNLVYKFRNELINTLCQIYY